ncbi:MAG: hypothetical protein IKT40_03610 [Bacilli bacterium]|jgi:hypothetical protein|nr:hypothetical protein [Bacilli bacterium]
MRTKPLFVEENDYFNYFGMDLKSALRIHDNESNAANLFLMQIEDKLLGRIDATSFRLYEWDRNKLSKFQLESLQKAILLQAEYIIRNSDLFSDSGYDLERGEVISYDKLQKIAICRSSIDLLKNCGLFNQTIKNRNRYPSFLEI